MVNLITLVLLFSGHLAFAEGDQIQIAPPSGHTELSNILHNKKFEPDQKITDTELKAYSGSLSRYSLKFDMTYSGPPVDNLNDPNMPNPDNRPRPNRTNLSGYMGLRYRLNPDEAINASTGMHWYSPYQAVKGEDVPRQKGDQNLTVANPQVSYDRTYIALASQMRTSLKASVTTEDYYLNAGQSANVGIEQALKYNVGQTRWILGMLIPVDLFIFHRDYRGYVSPKDKGDGKVSNYYLSYIPSVEYKITSNFNFKTSLAFSYSNTRMGGSWFKWAPQDLTQRVGFGWGITRDIYVNPYLNYYVERPKWASTSLSLGTTFSIF